MVILLEAKLVVSEIVWSNFEQNENSYQVSKDYEGFYDAKGQEIGGAIVEYGDR